MLRSIPLLLGAAGLALASCGRGPVEPLAGCPALVPQICGEWSWLESRGGFTGGDVRTPDSVGYSQRLIFQPDSTFQRFRGDSLAASGRFTVTRQTTMFGPATVVDYLNAAGDRVGLPQRVSFAGRDTLLLDDLCTDCYGHRYARAH
ncbi:MAG: hypothetical protein HY561_12600 [Gemmatimonadetes bacterium]|nr:hypothetical protein [Gemmatimonadota bacterium]